MSKQFYFKQFSLARIRSLNKKTKPINSRNHGLVQFDPSIGPCQVLPLLARVDLGAMAMKGCSAFPKTPAILESQHQIV